MSRIWFKPKRIGYGARPASWEGWTATFLAVFIVLADTRLVPPLFPNHQSGTLACIAVAAAVIGGLIWLTLVKGENVWRLNRDE